MKLKLLLISLLLILLFSPTLSADETLSIYEKKMFDTIDDSMANVVVIGQGSGFYVSPTRVITAYHVVQAMKEDRQQLPLINQQRPYEGAKIYGKLVKWDATWDYAVIEVPENKKVRKLQTGDVRTGQTVLMIGSPHGLNESVTKGMISYLNRWMDWNKDYTQIDGNINSGQSGSMVLDLNGSLVGVMVAKEISVSGIGYMIPIDKIKY